MTQDQTIGGEIRQPEDEEWGIGTYPLVKARYLERISAEDFLAALGGEGESQ